jgi:pimeloyl-ACP methyl ester carboxylesterase
MTGPVAQAREFDVTAPDGRVIHAYEAGDPAGELVVVHHGTPGSGLLARSWADDAASRGIRLVGFDRAGYAGSDRRADRRVADVAADTAAIADALGADRFHTWGTSGGGPHVLACAALLPDRVLAAASLAGVAPYDADGLEWQSGMGQANVEEFAAAAGGEPSLRGYLAQEREGILASTPETIAAALESLLPPVDAELLTGDWAGYLHAVTGHGLQNDYSGWLDDDLAFVREWGFDLAAISVPVLVMQGALDLMVPMAHGRWLADRVPGAEVVLSSDDGHLTLLEHIDRTHAWLMKHR